LIGFILLTKSLLCNVVAFSSESSRYSEFVSLKWKEPHYDKLHVSQASRRLFQCSRKILCRFLLKEVGSQASVRTTWYFIRMLISQQDPSGRRSIPSRRSSVKASSVRTTRTFRRDAQQCLETSNCSILHPSGSNGKLFRRY
jgi:hypothetical protein